MELSQEEKRKRINEVREICGVGLMDCSRALEKYVWDVEKAVTYLRFMGTAVNFTRPIEDVIFDAMQEIDKRRIM